MPEIDGYKYIPLRVTADVEHPPMVYLREHFIRLMDPNKPKGRTLFILNVPPYVTEDSLRKFFSGVGAVNHVSFAAKPGREETQKWSEFSEPFTNSTTPFKFKVAYIVFKLSISVARALQLPAIDLFSKISGEPYIESGMQLWHSEHQKRILDEEKVQVDIDQCIAEYDEHEAQEIERAKNAEPDADGWVTVGKHGRNAGFEQKASVIDRLEDKVERSKKKKELANFYTFQIRESKMKHIVELRQKFEEDKRKIELLKQKRRFRPF